MSKYITRISLKRKGASGSRYEKRGTRNYAGKKWGSKKAGSKGPRSKLGGALSRKKVRKVIQIVAGFFFVLLFLGILGGLWYMQALSKDLPSPDAPFGAKDTASVIHDRNGQQLYKVYGNENRDPLELPSEDASINEIVPPQVVWAFLAAEDIDFYSHPGFDVTSTTNCAIKNVLGTSSCGGSTLTQQLVKQTVLTSERKLERKFKELMLSLQIERKYSKDQILAMYLTVAPMGSNVYGVNTGAQFYFDKDLQDLTIAEAAVLASLPQNPSILSPTLSTDPEKAQLLLDGRKNYVLDQMLKYKDKINKEVGDDEFITEAKIDEARNQELVYAAPRIDIKAPHFVFYVQQLLQERGYNSNEPFTLAELETGGYKITTTLDYELQKTAEDAVLKEGVGKYGALYGGNNAALTTIRPSTGEVLTYVGSKDYYGEKKEKLFDPQVDILTSLQQPGSSAKPITYYNAFRDGVAAPGTQVPDIPIEIGTYKPKNSDGKFTGLNTVRSHLVLSKNIPAIIMLEATGVAKYVDTGESFGYRTYSDPSSYGPSITLGAAEVRPIEHAEVFGVFSNGGNHVQHEVILKIENKEGKVIYEYKPEVEKVADEKAIYLVNDVLRGVPGSYPAYTGDGREIAGKTGTSEDQRDTWFVMYSPDFVTVGWLGNNDNTAMVRGAFGSTSVKPWVQNYMSSILAYFPEKTSFTRPGGIITSQICSDDGTGKYCVGTEDLLIEGKMPPTYMTKKTFRVCDDQQDRLSREIDEVTGHAIDKEFTSYTMPVASLQQYADQYLQNTVFPTESCTIDRSPNAGKPWAVISSPASGATVENSLSVGFNAYTLTGIVTKAEVYVDSNKVDETTSLPYSKSINVSSFSAGAHTLKIKVYDSVGNSGDTSVAFNINKGGFTINSPSGLTVSSPVTVVATFTGSGSTSNVKLCVDGTCTISMSDIGGNQYSATWSPTPGIYTIQIKAGDGASSPTKQVTVVI